MYIHPITKGFLCLFIDFKQRTLFVFSFLLKEQTAASKVFKIYRHKCRVYEYRLSYNVEMGFHYISLVLLSCHQVVTGQGGVDIGRVLAGVKLPPPELGGVVRRRGGVITSKLVTVAVIEHLAASFLSKVLTLTLS